MSLLMRPTAHPSEPIRALLYACSVWAFSGVVYDVQVRAHPGLYMRFSGEPSGVSSLFQLLFMCLIRFDEDPGSSYACSDWAFQELFMVCKCWAHPGLYMRFSGELSGVELFQLLFMCLKFEPPGLDTGLKFRAYFGVVCLCIHASSPFRACVAIFSSC